MAKYRNNLPQISDNYFITDGGLETTLVFQKSIELPYFGAFVLLETDKGRNILMDYYKNYISIAKEYEVGFILESPTWRSSSKWGKLLGYSIDTLEKLNREAIELLVQIRNDNESDKTKIVISGCIGPYGDGYFI